MSEIALVDCDSFFVSCEQLVNPSLLHKPVCVMSNNDGCVIARSREAKKLGIKMGMPVFMARKEFPKAIYLSGNMALYGEISARVMAKLMEYSPTVEVYSIDEAFLDLTGLRRMYRKSYLDIIRDIRDSVKLEVGVPVSIGVSKTKTLAKLASEKAKKDDGAYAISSRTITGELRKTEPGEIWGVGINTAELLRKYRIKTAYEFVQVEDVNIQKLLGRKGLELKQELLGNSVYRVSDDYVAPKSIQKTSSFGNFTSDRDYIKKALHYHSHRACAKLRKLGLKAKVIGMMLRTKDFKVYLEKAVLLQPTDWEFEVNKAVNAMFEKVYKPGVIYRSAGVYLEDLSQESQMSLFSSVPDIEKNRRLASSWDRLENRYGRGVITTGQVVIK